MNKRLDDLGKRLIECKRWQWLDGMPAKSLYAWDNGLRVSGTQPGDTEHLYLSNGVSHNMTRYRLIPNLECPSMLGYLWHLVQLAWAPNGATWSMGWNAITPDRARAGQVYFRPWGDDEHLHFAPDVRAWGPDVLETLVIMLEKADELLEAAP